MNVLSDENVEKKKFNTSTGYFIFTLPLSSVLNVAKSFYAGKYWEFLLVQAIEVFV